MITYESVMGLEIHVELNTRSKMFCRCSTDYFGKAPNTLVCPVCLGLPGATPFANKVAIASCMKIGLALGCKINTHSIFERKNYFYPDLAKGYQISQLRWPLCVNGAIEIINAQGESRTIRINRVHQEEDTGKLSHIGNETMIDFNRCGIPLVEIVTEADFRESFEVRDYAKKIQQLIRYLGVSNADMERGDMRLEANISVRPEGQKELPNYRVELKNINSFRFMVAAVEYEIKRQIAALENGETLRQETRGWNPDKKETFIQRVKEEANDYRYFPDPDFPRIEVTEAEVERVKMELPQLPAEKIKRYMEELALPQAQATILSGSTELAEYFESAVEHGKNHDISAVEIGNYLVNKKVDIDSVLPTQIIEEIIGKKTSLLDDDQELGRLVDQVISENSKLVEEYRLGKLNVVQVLIGMVMKKSLGRANAFKVKQILETKLSK